jgi:ferredoxin-NADP reductase
MPQWQRATLVESHHISCNVKSLTFTVDGWQPHQCGQFYDVSIDGGQTSRCYSVASAPETEGRVEFGVELISGGTVSPTLHKLISGDSILVSGPYGLPVFTWNYEMLGSLVLIGGGSGIVPLISMVRHYVTHRDTAPRAVTIISSAVTADDLVYHQELLTLIYGYSEISYTPIATQDMKWQGRRDRINLSLLTEVLDAQSHVYVCGSFALVAEVGDLAQSLVPTSQVHREYFG